MDPVLVTGSGGLIGRRVAERLHEAGVDVLGVDLRPGDGPFPSTVGDAADADARQPARHCAGQPGQRHGRVRVVLSASAPSQLCYDITGETYVTVPGPPAWNEGHLGPLLIGAARRDLRYTPKVSLRDGLAELAAGLNV